MDPISPDSLKRSSPSQSGDDYDEPITKKRRLLEPTLPHTPPPEEDYDSPRPQERMFNDDPKHLLLRSIALALKHVGFDSAKPAAIEALASQAESCWCPMKL